MSQLYSTSKLGNRNRAIKAVRLTQISLCGTMEHADALGYLEMLYELMRRSLFGTTRHSALKLGLQEI